MDYNIRNVLSTQRVAIYIRVSTHFQVDKDSLPLQRSDLINYAKYALNIDSYEIFEDAGYSAKNTDRPAYQQMMSRLRTGEFSHILVWKIDRISRNLLDFAAMYEEIKKLGVTFVSKNEQFDTSTAIGEAMLKIILVFAELERKMTSERVTAVMLSRATKGQWNGGRVPYGYTYDKTTKEFQIDETESAYVHTMFDMYESGKSLTQIAKSLNEKGVKSRRGSAWTPTTIWLIIKNLFYTGEYVYNMRKDGLGGSNPKNFKAEKEWITVSEHHPAIITKEQWQRCSEIRNEKFKTGLTHGLYQRKNINIFAGLIECGKCGSMYQATSYCKKIAAGYKPSIYLCTRRRRYNDCDNKSVLDSAIGPFVFNYISNIMKASGNIGKSTTLDMFQKKLLRGDVFSDVKSISGSGLREMYDMMKSGKFDSDVFSAKDNPTEQQDDFTTERELLLSEKRKHERALNRLKSLYLYGDESLSEAEFIIERKELLDNIGKVDKRLEEIEQNASELFSISDNDFLEKASYFIMSQELQGKRYINFDTLMKHSDPEILKKFITAVIKKIVILDDKITTIQFKNGIEHNFLYNEQ